MDLATLGSSLKGRISFFYVFFAIFQKFALYELLQNVLAGIEIIDSADECNGGDDAHHNNWDLRPNVVEAWNEGANGIDSSEQNRDDADSL